jgi:ABC-type nickel/cobalt efflux system permease component RcnA
MESIGILLFGLVMGMRHALEVDHVAAVATLATRTRSLGQAVSQGMVWGLGHTLTLFLFGGAVLWMDRLVPERLAGWLEAAVGVMLIGLGGDLLRRLVRQRIHFHRHRHADGTEHFHAHSHAEESGEHDPGHHRHSHLSRAFPLRSLLVGLMHGMAGSAALILLTLETVDSPLMGLAYIALFGFGSILGMGALSLVIAFPMQFSARRVTWLHQGVQALAGIAAVALGIGMVAELSGYYV